MKMASTSESGTSSSPEERKESGVQEEIAPEPDDGLQYLPISNAINCFKI